MFGYKHVFSILIFSAAITVIGTPAFAVEPLIGVVQTNIQSCKTLKLESGKFRPAAKLSLRPGQRLLGHLHRKRSDLFITSAGSDTLAVSTLCINTQPNPDAKAEAPTAAGLAAPGRFEGRFRFLFYQDVVTVTDVTVGAYTIIGHINAVCPGIAYRQPLTERFNLVADACVIFGFADARGTTSNETLDVRYEFSHALTLGMRLVPGIEMPFAGKDFRIGLGVPMIYQWVAWGDTADGGTATSSGLKFPGALLTIQGTRDRWGFIADFGFLKGLTRTMYSLGVSYQL